MSPPKLRRNNGAAYRTDKFPPPYIATEHPVGERFMTTVEKQFTAPYHIFMLHGGGYSAEALPRHSDIVRVLATRGFRVTAFAYPLFPEHDVIDIHEAAYTAWKPLTKSRNF